MECATVCPVNEGAIEVHQQQVFPCTGHWQDAKLHLYTASLWREDQFSSLWEHNSTKIFHNESDFKWREEWYTSGFFHADEWLGKGSYMDDKPPTGTRLNRLPLLTKKTEFSDTSIEIVEAFDADYNLPSADQPQDCFYLASWQSSDPAAYINLTSSEPFLIDQYLQNVQTFRSRKEIRPARLLRAIACSHGLEDHVVVGNHIVPMLVECGSLDDAQQVFNKLADGNEHAWTSLISGFSERGQWHHCLSLYQRMQELCVSPTSHTYVALLKACAEHKDISKGQQLYLEMALTGLEAGYPVGNTLVSMYAKCGLLDDAEKVFVQLPNQDFVSWNCLISGYAEYGPFEEALNVFQRMQSSNISPTDGTYASILKACGSLGVIESGQKVHMDTIQRGSDGFLSVGNSLVGMYAKCGAMSESKSVFDRLPVRDVVSWTALLSGYVEHGPAQEGLLVFERMQAQGVMPNHVTFACVLKACGILGALCKGRAIHRLALNKRFGGVPSVCNSLISMYTSCGSISEALEIFQGLPMRDTVSWSSLIKGLAMNHESLMATMYFEDMQKEGVQPNGLTFSSLFKACSHARLACEGSRYFKMMAEDYSIEPSREHYSCMIDLLAKSGHLYEAERFLEMLCPLLEGAWTALLAACRTYGEAELGSRCFQQLVTIKPEDSVGYLLVEDLYAGKGWGAHVASRMEDLRIHLGAINRPGVATIEVNERVFEFVGGNDQSKELASMLEAVKQCVKEGGHVPDLDVVFGPMSEEKKESVLCQHAERFAIAFGLVNMPQGETLRITKNLRMCYDCHSVSKLVSRTERREIVLRDNCCIHHFKDGLCLCGDVY